MSINRRKDCLLRVTLPIIREVDLESKTKEIKATTLTSKLMIRSLVNFQGTHIALDNISKQSNRNVEDSHNKNNDLQEQN